jgi:DNA topoisomerase-1
VQHQKTYANLSSAEEVFTLGINRAVSLLAEKQTKSSRGSTVLKELGEHPTDGGPVQVLSGRYGPYVKYGKINATLPKDLDPEALSLDDAVKLVAEKAAKTGKKASTTRKTTKKKTTSKPKAKQKAKQD